MGASESKQSVADFDSIIPSTNIHTTGTISKIPQLSSGVKGDVHQASETKRGGGLHLDLLNVPIVAAPVLGYSEFENTISQVAPCLFVSGGKVAASRDILVEHSIQRIVNCCASTIPNYFESDSDLKYLGLKLLDAKEENINWFVAKVLCFINDGISNHENVLLHCEKGISRSCSFAIAYQMWKYKCNYIDAFSTVQQARSICNPNAGFICNLVELQYVLSVAGIPKPTFLFRYSSHSKYDPSTPLLKICMDDTNRKLLIPNLKYFKSYAVYAVVPGDGKSPSTVYLWRGNEVDDEAVNLAIELLKELCNFIGTDTFIEMVHQGRETQEFRLHVLDSEDSNTSSLYDFDDLVGHTNYGLIEDTTHMLSVHIIQSEDTSQEESAKPRLFKAEPDEGAGFVWQDLGVYDDDDLDESSLLLLYCGLHVDNFVWVGSAVDLAVADDSVRGYLKSVNLGDSVVFHDGVFEDIQVIRQGIETAIFWAAFNEGY